MKQLCKNEIKNSSILKKTWIPSNLHLSINQQQNNPILVTIATHIVFKLMASAHHISLIRFIYNLYETLMTTIIQPSVFHDYKY